jgi:small subunit ribosomal protein S6
MTVAANTYDLPLVLAPGAEDTARAKIVADARAAIEAQGELLRDDDWGERPLSYPIERRTSGEYHLLQFRPSSTELLSGLDRTLRITDGILRFRIIKLRPGVPDAPDMRAAANAPRRAEAETGAAPAAPAGGEQSSGGEQPAADAEPSAGEQPAADAEPSAGEQPANGSGPSGGEQPAADAEPSAAAETAGGDPA